jgi:hypothetical protein
MKQARIGTLIAGLLVMLASHASAQSTCGAPTGTLVIDPTEICFESPDHAKVRLAGGPLITEYQLSIFLRGVDTSDVSKRMTYVKLGRGEGGTVTGTVIRIPRSALGAMPTGQELVATVDEIYFGGVVRSPAGSFFGYEKTAPPAPATAPVATSQQ